MQTVEAVTLDEYLGRFGLSSPISSFMLDKMRLPHGNTLRQQKRLEKECLDAARNYSSKRKVKIAEYNEKIASGEFRNKTVLEQRIEIANGSEDNESTMAAKRRLAKDGIEWRK